MIASVFPSRSFTVRMLVSSRETTAYGEDVEIVATALTGTPLTAFWVRLTPSAHPEVSDLVPTSWTVTAEPRP